jgi:hypothetical protein
VALSKQTEPESIPRTTKNRFALAHQKKLLRDTATDF